jgi:hypothetical protein
MTRSTQQTYIQKLGFQDADRQNQRHGLACEYLAEQLFEQKVFSLINEESIQKNRSLWFSSDHDERQWRALSATAKQGLLANEIKKQISSVKEEALSQVCYSNFINVPIKNRGYINGFADVLIKRQWMLNAELQVLDDGLKLFLSSLFMESWNTMKEGPFKLAVLGEIKITPEPAENIIQQIKFYREFIEVARVVILVDFDAPDLQRLVKGSDIELYRLGDKFEAWVKNRSKPTTEEF